MTVFLLVASPVLAEISPAVIAVVVAGIVPPCHPRTLLKKCYLLLSR